MSANATDPDPGTATDPQQQDPPASNPPPANPPPDPAPPQPAVEPPQPPPAAQKELAERNTKILEACRLHGVDLETAQKYLNDFDLSAEDVMMKLNQDMATRRKLDAGAPPEPTTEDEWAAKWRPDYEMNRHNFEKQKLSFEQYVENRKGYDLDFLSAQERKRKQNLG